MSDEKKADAGKNKNNLDTLMRSMLDRVREMADVNTIVGQPIETADGVTLIPVSKLNFGLTSGGGSYGKTAKDGFAGGGAASVKIEPVAFLIVRDGMTRLLPVAAAPVSTVDRIVDMAPDLITKAENFLMDKKREKTEENREE